LCVAAWVWFCLSTEFVERVGRVNPGRANKCCWPGSWPGAGSDRVVLGHARGRARGQSGPGGPGLADIRPRRVMEPCRKLDHRGVNPTHTEPQPDTAGGHDTRETQPPTKKEAVDHVSDCLYFRLLLDSHAVLPSCKWTYAHPPPSISVWYSRLVV